MIRKCVRLKTRSVFDPQVYGENPEPSPAQQQTKRSMTQEPLHQKPPLSRSLTDSSIQYSQEERVEVPGTTNYVTNDGHLDLRVLLKVCNLDDLFFFIIKLVIQSLSLVTM